MSATASELWIFRCCVMPSPRPKRPQIRIDRSMIGLPQNFQHLSHVGQREMELPDDQLIALQNQMQSKGGYQTNYKDTSWSRK